MKIHLTEQEIVDAITNNLLREGFDVKGKLVKAKFVAGRKGAGLTVDITVDDVHIPGLELADNDDVDFEALKEPEQVFQRNDESVEGYKADAPVVEEEAKPSTGQRKLFAD